MTTGRSKKTSGGGLVLVVGPSGSGKDTLLTICAELVAGNDQIVFPRRMITRNPDGSLENSIEISAERFDEMRMAGEFSFCWKAHDQAYGLPASIDQAIKQGAVVVFNASRSIIGDALSRYDHVLVVHIEVPPQVLIHRLRGRGRETGTEILGRLERANMALPDGVHAVSVKNDKTPKEGAHLLAQIISDFVEDIKQPGRPANDN